jgi:hypothetical protein
VHHGDNIKAAHANQGKSVNPGATWSQSANPGATWSQELGGGGDIDFADLGGCIITAVK